MPYTNKSCETIGGVIAITSYDTTINQPSEVIYIHHSQLSMKHLPVNDKREQASILLLDKEGRIILEFKEEQDLQNYFNEMTKIEDIIPQLVDFLSQ